MFGYELRKIDGALHDRCLENPVTADFVSVFDGKDNYLKLGYEYAHDYAAYLVTPERRTH